MKHNVKKQTEKAQVEIPTYLFTQLLDSGLLHYGDCKCLNANAKSAIWHTLLANSINYDVI